MAERRLSLSREQLEVLPTVGSDAHLTFKLHVVIDHLTRLPKSLENWSVS
jgi:hypothetical protein